MTIRRIVENALQGNYAYRVKKAPGLPLKTYLLFEEACRRISCDRYITKQKFICAMLAVVEDWEKAPFWDSGFEMENSTRHVGCILEMMSGRDEELWIGIVNGLNEKSRKELRVEGAYPDYLRFDKDYYPRKKWAEEIRRLVLAWRQCLERAWKGKAEVGEDFWSHFEAALARTIYEDMTGDNSGNGFCKVNVRRIEDVLGEIMPERSLPLDSLPNFRHEVVRFNGKYSVHSDYS